MRALFVVLIALANAGQPVQSAMNARLREAMRSPTLAAFTSLVVSLVVLGIAWSTGWLGRGSVTSITKAPPWALVGGAIGATSVLLNLLALPRIGALAMIGASVFGQLVAAAVIDHFGWLGAPRAPLGLARLLGMGLLLGGVFLVQRR